jgi:3-hydroxy-9,10-secoandrosta-1,3,5(10)-triene-9,17-dione monooxygenase
VSSALERAQALRGALAGAQAQAAASGCCTAGSHELVREGGLHAMLIPRRGGGLGLELPDFIAVVSELARGCPPSAWCAASLAVGSARAHALFETDGDARCALGLRGEASAQRTPSGWSVTGRFARCAGALFATHFLGVAQIEGEDGVLRFLAARAQLELLEHGGGACAATVVLEAAAISEAFASPAAAMVDAWSASVPAAALAAVFAGAAARAAELAETVVAAAPATRALDPDHQRWLGAAMAHAAAATAVLSEAAARGEAGLTLAALARQSMRYAWQAAQEALPGSAAADRRERDELERIARFMLNGLDDGAVPAPEWIARQLARERLELALDAALPAS